MTPHWTEGELLTELSDGIAIAILNRPQRGNAWTDNIEQRYKDFLELSSVDPTIRATILTGTGRHFCVGADMANLQTAAVEQQSSSRVLTAIDVLQHPKPLIAAINGSCAGIGLIHALLCDVRFASTEAKFTTAFARRGLIAEHGISWILPRVIGRSHALDLLISARVITAYEAKELGLIDYLCQPEQVIPEALLYASDISQNASPTSVAVIKNQLHASASQTIQEALELANSEMNRSFERPDFLEGVRSFVEHRKPNFPPFQAK